MINEGAFQTLQLSFEKVSGVKPDYRELIKEHGEEKALKILAHSYYTTCKTYGAKPVRTNNPIVQGIIDSRIEDDKLANEYNV